MRSISKYNAQPTVVENADGSVIRFDSKREARRYGELCLLVRAGEISDLELQVKYPLIVNGTKIGVYIADFRYRSKDGLQHTEDSKGVRTAVYALKKRIVKALYGIDIEEV